MLDVKKVPVVDQSTTVNLPSTSEVGLLDKLRNSSTTTVSSNQGRQISPRKSSPINNSRISPSRNSEINEPRYASLISSPAPASLPLPAFEMNPFESSEAPKSSSLPTSQTPTQPAQPSSSPSPLSPVLSEGAKHPRQHKFAPKQLFGQPNNVKKVYQPRNAPRVENSAVASASSSGAESSQLNQMSNELKSILNIEGL